MFISTATLSILSWQYILLVENQKEPTNWKFSRSQKAGGTAIRDLCSFENNPSSNNHGNGSKVEKWWLQNSLSCFAESSGTCIAGDNLRATLIYRFLVIKCPGKDSFKDFAYLLWKDDRTYTFKTTHEYYFQMVGQMGGSLVWNGVIIFVRCKQDCCLEHICFNPEEWENIKSKLDSFSFFMHVLPALYSPVIGKRQWIISTAFSN